MSVPPRRRVPERPSLEQLRKQAKEHRETALIASGPHQLPAPVSRSEWSRADRCVQRGEPV